MVKETLCLEASTVPLPKLGLGPLSACLTGGVVGVSCGKIKGVDLEKFKGRVSPTVDPHLFSLCLLYLPVRLSLPLPNFLHSLSLLPLFVLIFQTSPY